MEWDDIIYLLILISSIGFGHVFRSIEDKHVRKNVSTLVGFLIVFLTSGKHISHIILCTIVNWLIFQCCSKKKIHVYSFAFSFIYLLFFRTTEYFGIPYSPSHTNLIQMILTLKLVGLAYEIHDSDAGKSIDVQSAEHEFTKVLTPSLVETFHYTFCYIGVLTGPYFSYRSYWDLFNRPFSKYAPCEKATTERARMLPLYAAGFLVASYIYPLKYVQSEDFYRETTVLYRLWYVIPTFFVFRMRMYIGMRLGECVFTMAGLGAYPVSTKPRSGKGPTTNFENLLLLSKEEARAKLTEYSFDTIYNIEPKGTEFDYTVRSSMKSWNMTVQFWLANFVYKRFPIKPYRMLVTFLTSSFWHGIHAGHYLCISSVPFYLPIEDIYAKNLQHLPEKSPLIEKLCFGMAYSWRMLLMGYWSMSFSLLEIRPALRYWSSVYFLPTLTTLIMYAVSLVIFPKQHNREKRSN